MTYDLWPTGVEKSALPPGYEWVCLRPALGIGSPGKHPWFARVVWTIRDGRRQRMLRATRDFFPTAAEAAEDVRARAWEHYRNRAGGPP